MSLAVRLGVVAGLLAGPAGLAAQDPGKPARAATGRIVGVVVAAEGGSPLAGARVIVEGTALVTTTRVDGRLRLDNVPPGNLTLRVAMIGFAPKAVIGVIVKPGDVTTQDISLAAQAPSSKRSR